MSMLPVMAALDADRDGELSGEEIANASAALKTLDKNEDGKLTFEELRPQLNRGGDDATGNRFGSRGRGPNPEQVVDRWMTMDKNGDQKLTREEVPQRMRTVFARGDANEDGQLDREELTSIAEQRMNRGGREDAGRRNRRTREDGRPQRPQPQEREERRERD